MRILVADDHTATRHRIAAQLTASLGRTADVVVASTGFEALALFERAHREGRPFELVVLDVAMPMCDGISVARSLRTDGRFVALPPIWGLVGTEGPVAEGWPFDQVWGKDVGEIMASSLRRAA